MKIRPHPRLQNIRIGDEVYCLPRHLTAAVHDVFPAAVCVRVGVITFGDHVELDVSRELWRADDIENLSVCHYCGGREGVALDETAPFPVRVCRGCANIASEKES